MRLSRLRTVRELHGWSQTTLAEESGVSRDSISNYETGHREAWPATAKKLADALGVEIANLIEPAREPALPKAEAPPAGGIPHNLEELLERRGARTRHIADESLPGKLRQAPLEEAIRIAEEVYAEAEAINPDLVRLIEEFRHDTKAMSLLSEAKTQLLITRLIVADKRRQKFVPVEPDVTEVETEAEPVEQKLLEQELALAG